MTECIGYRVPLFLGGSDTIENLEKIDMDVVPDAATPEVLDTILLCRSHGRESKEKAMFSNAEERFVRDLTKLNERLNE